MKPLLLLLALGLPISAVATVAMGPQATMPSQAASQPDIASQPHPAVVSPHHPLFIVKYVLRRAPPDKTPPIVVDDKAQIMPPSVDGYPSAALGAVRNDPNKIICYGRACEGM